MQALFVCGSSLLFYQISSAEKGILIVAFEEMQARSEAADAAPKAQQQPQLDWSRMSLMTWAHWGQAAAD